MWLVSALLVVRIKPSTMHSGCVLFRRLPPLAAVDLLQFFAVHQLDGFLGVLNVPQQRLQPPLDLLLVLQSAADHDGLEPLVDGDGRSLGHTGGVQGEQLLPAAVHVVHQLFQHLVYDGRGLVQGVLLLGVPDRAHGDLHGQRAAHETLCRQLQLFSLPWEGEKDKDGLGASFKTQQLMCCPLHANAGQSCPWRRLKMFENLFRGRSSTHVHTVCIYTKLHFTVRM